MTVKTLIEKLSHYNKDAIVRLHHREIKDLIEKTLNDMGETGVEVRVSK